MPFVIFHEGGKVVALDETDGARLIITEWDDEQECDVLWGIVTLPANGIEVMDCSLGKGPQSEAAPPAPRVAAWAQRS